MFMGLIANTRDIIRKKVTLAFMQIYEWYCVARDYKFLFHTMIHTKSNGKDSSIRQ